MYFRAICCIFNDNATRNATRFAVYSTSLGVSRGIFFEYTAALIRETAYSKKVRLRLILCCNPKSAIQKCPSIIGWASKGTEN